MIPSMSRSNLLIALEIADALLLAFKTLLVFVETEGEGLVDEGLVVMLETVIVNTMADAN